MRRLAAAALLVAAGLAGEARAGQGPLGQQDEYSLRLVSDLRTGSTAVLHLELSGVWQVVPIEVAPTRTVLHARLGNPVVKVTPEKAAHADRAALITRDLARACSFTVDEAGAVSAVRIDPGLEPLAQSLLRTIIATSQLVRSKAPAGASWETDEVDVSGRYHARYSVLDATKRYVREKLDYAEPGPGGAPGAANARTKVIKSRTTFALLPNGRLNTLESTEEVETAVRDLPPFSARTATSLRFGKTTDVGGSMAGLRRIASKWAASGLDQVPPRQITPPADFDRARVGGQTFADLLQRVQAFGAATDHKEKERVFSALVSLFRLDRSALALAKAAVLEQPGERASFLLAALRDAGSPESQRTLLEVLDRCGPDRRLTVVQHLSRVVAPTAATVSRLIELLGEPALSVTAQFGLGAAAHALTALDEATTRRALDALLRELGRGRDPTSLANTLRALGTAGHPSLLGPIRRYLQHPSESVRAAAADALRRMPSGQADELLAGVLGADGSQTVRTSALHACRERAPYLSVTQAAASLAEHDPTTAVRLEAVRLLGDRVASFTEARASLGRVSAHDPDARLRAAAQEQLARR